MEVGIEEGLASSEARDVSCVLELVAYMPGFACFVRTDGRHVHIRAAGSRNKEIDTHARLSQLVGCLLPSRVIRGEQLAFRIGSMDLGVFPHRQMSGAPGRQASH